MKILLNYNFRESDICDNDFDALYRIRRRDAGFAFVYQDGDTIYAIRDHLGICPLWYMSTHRGFVFSTNLADLPHSNTLSSIGLRSYLSLGTTKVTPLFEETHLVPPGAVVRFSKNKPPETIYQYRIIPHPSSILRTFSSIVSELDTLIRTAIHRQVENTTQAVGLCLSGGIDSGLIGLYLKELGVPIVTFSALKKGAADEQNFLNTNIRALTPEKTHVHELSVNYGELSQDIPSLYRQPHGNTTALAISSLWLHTPIAETPLLFFGQNSDVINNAMDNRDVTIFSRYLPSFLHKKDRALLHHMLGTYMDKHSGGLLKEDPLNLHHTYTTKSYTNFQILALAGMFLRRTPVDSELLAQPAINANIPIGNPYYDLDVIEYILGIRLMHKLRIGKNIHIPLSLDKRVLQALAIQKGLPPELVYRKEGFTVSRGQAHKSFFESLPIEVMGAPCINKNQQFAAHILRLYQKKKQKHEV